MDIKEALSDYSIPFDQENLVLNIPFNQSLKQIQTKQLKQLFKKQSRY
jgi:hypothetical protein